MTKDKQFKNISISLPKSVQEQVDGLAETNHRSRSNMIVELLRLEIERIRANKDKSYEAVGGVSYEPRGAAEDAGAEAPKKEGAGNGLP